MNVGLDADALSGYDVYPQLPHRKSLTCIRIVLKAVL